MNDEVKVVVWLSHERAEALSQLAKRMLWDDVRKMSASDDEAYLMMGAINDLSKALAEVGFDPR